MSTLHLLPGLQLQSHGGAGREALTFHKLLTVKTFQSQVAWCLLNRATVTALCCLVGSEQYDLNATPPSPQPPSYIIRIKLKLSQRHSCFLSVRAKESRLWSCVQSVCSCRIGAGDLWKGCPVGADGWRSVDLVSMLEKREGERVSWILRMLTKW